MKNKTVAILLALFLGGFGAHWFYLEKPGLGALYLLTFWTFIPAIFALINVIQFAFTSDEKWEEIYG